MYYIFGFLLFRFSSRVGAIVSYTVLSLTLALTVGSPSDDCRVWRLIDFFQLPFEIKFKVFIMFYILFCLYYSSISICLTFNPISLQSFIFLSPKSKCFCRNSSKPLTEHSVCSIAFLIARVRASVSI